MMLVYNNETKAATLARKLGTEVATVEETDGGEYVAIKFANGFTVRGYSFDIFTFNHSSTVRYLKRAMAEYLTSKQAQPPAPADAILWAEDGADADGVSLQELGK